MIAGLSKAITLYLAPLVTLTTVILSLLALLSPTLILQTSTALLVVAPASLTNKASHVDGPSLFLGILGSCSRSNNDGAVTCTLPTFSPTYDLSALPSAAPTLLLSAPTAAVPIFVGISLVLTVIFFLSFTLISFRHKMGEKLTATLDKPLLQNTSAWLGVFGFFIGITCFLVMRMWFGKAVQDFNAMVMQNGKPELNASIGTAFTMAWVAYAFYAVPLIISLSKLNVKAAK